MSRARQVRLVVDPYELIQRLHAELLRFSTQAGHRVMGNYREHRGECSHRRCSPSCTSYRALMDDATDYLLGLSRPAERPSAGEGSVA